MNREYWLEKWQQHEVEFNQSSVNKHLETNLHLLNIKPSDRIFVPLCGKSIDMLWLSDQGFTVLGVEISPIAVEDFFIQNKIQFAITKRETFDLYTSQGIQIFCGDFFQLNQDTLGAFDAVYDRAALGALPPELRTSYVKQLKNLLIPGAKILLITVEYSPSHITGPPFSLCESEVKKLFSIDFQIQVIEEKRREDIPPHLIKKGIQELRERVYLIEYLRN